MLRHLLQCSLISRTLNHPRNLHIVMLVTWNFHVYVYLIELMINEVLWGTEIYASYEKSRPITGFLFFNKKQCDRCNFI